MLIVQRRRVSVYDPDAQAYITAVEAADTQALEVGVKDAINAFVVGCKADGIWPAIKASCIMAGARTLAGALVPLVGATPVRAGTQEDWDYARKTGLKANGIDNDIDTGRNNNAGPQDSKHAAVWISTHHTRNQTRADFGARGSSIGGSQLMTTTTARFYRLNWTSTGTSFESDTATTTGFWGASRSSATTTTGRYAGLNKNFTNTSTTPGSGNMRIFSREQDFSDARLAFYSIGESLDLALLDARVTTLINTFGAAIP